MDFVSSGSNPGIPLNYTEGERVGWGPADYDRYKTTLENSVFGVDHKKDNKGRPIEQGIGTRGRETPNHWKALRQAEKEGFEEPGTYDRLWKEFQARKKET
jgi:hypothetical protein